MKSRKDNSSKRSDDTMDDDSDDKDSKRKSRNLSEKKRRDQFNLLVNELSSMVSIAGRKMDKSTVLKSTIAFLKNYNENAVRSRVNEIEEDWKPTFLTNEEFTHLVLEALDGFIIVFSTSECIHYASDSVTSLLGYTPKDLLNKSIFDLICDEDHGVLFNIFARVEDDKQVTFSCHLKRNGQEKLCELVNFVGYFRQNHDEGTSSKFQSGDTINHHRSIFVGTAKIQTPLLIKDMPTNSNNKSEFTSRHSLEWKFLFLDHRAPPIIGYLPFELLGTSGYEYYHVDDLEKVIECHEALMQKGEGTSCFYRFLTKGQQWIWLQTRFFITYHQWNSKPEFVVCTHRVVSSLDVLKKQSNVIDEAHQWRGRVLRDSDCASTSPDSPGSLPSTEKCFKSKLSQTVPSPRESISPRPVQFLEPNNQYDIEPIQPIITYQSPVVINESPVQIHEDLQRKQAELQAMIGQQQQELRRVSEQLLMARLGLLPTPSGSATVSSTTASVPILSISSNRGVYQPDSNTQNDPKL